MKTFSDDRPKSFPNESAAAPGIGFLLSRIDYERTPPSKPSDRPFKLERMRELLRRVGDPHLKVPCVHIAGSKGKGSTAAMLEAILRAGGRKTGLFTSPHIHRFEERIQIDGREIDSEDLEELIESLRSVALAMDVEPFGGPTFFELITAAGWLEFARRQVDIAVVEVGLGGRLDATTVCSPLACMITSISRDHTRLLGDSLESIATEKAGIIKQGIPVFSGVDDHAARRVIVDRCESKFAALYEVGTDLVIDKSPGVNKHPLIGDKVKITTPWGTHRDVLVPLPGHHQQRNAALAIAVADHLARHEGSTPCDETDIATGFSQVDWPMRIEVVGESPTIILDAAHNEASIIALIETLQQVSDGERTVLFGTSKDKDAAAMLMHLAEAFDRVILTQYSGNPRALPAANLADLAEKCGHDNCSVMADAQAAFQEARDISADEDLICVTGSFFLCGEIRQTLV